MINRFVDRFISILVLGILADHRDADLVLGVPQRVHEVIPCIELWGRSDKSESLGNEFVQAMVSERQGDFVDGKIAVFFFDHSFERDVAEQGDFFAFFA